jgi:hypothetical protein
VQFVELEPRFEEDVPYLTMEFNLSLVTHTTHISEGSGVIDNFSCCGPLIKIIDFDKNKRNNNNEKKHIAQTKPKVN